MIDEHVFSTIIPLEAPRVFDDYLYNVPIRD